MTNCKNCNQPFTIYPEDQTFYSKIGVSEPTECPDCRQQRRIAWRNFTNLYVRQCELTGKDVVSRFSPQSKIKVINIYDWNSDKWDPIRYGRDYDLSRSFFEQFVELYKDIPHSAIWTNNCHNCDYTNLSAYSNNCYMVFGCVGNEDCYYGHIVWNSQDCRECLYIRKCELCFKCIDCNESYGLFWCSDCSGCNDCKYCYYCKGCQDCVGCYGLINQHQHVLNKPCANDEEYHREVEKFMALGEAVRQAKINELRKVMPVRESTIIGCVNCTGNYIYRSKNCQDCYDTKVSEDTRYCYTLQNGTETYDCCYTAWEIELSYNILASYGYRLLCCQGCLENSSELDYCQECNAIKNCFGCIGLHNKEQYYILNKKYSEAEYKELRDKIISALTVSGEWGSFFPIACSPFGYNETMAAEYYPLIKEAALAKGYNWLDPDQRDYQEQTYQVPIKIEEVQDDVLTAVLACERCRRNYKIIKQELDFYRKYGLPLPRKCFHCRHAARMEKRNPRKLFERSCAHCNKTIRTTYALDRPEKVYCEECYNREVY
ncbi:MAG: zinc-ribbon domain containing protein [Patescibacteria group bacterium]